MSRTKSKHMVTILKIDEWQKNITKFMLEKGKIDEYTRMEAGYLPLGIIEKDGKHYLIDHEGVGSFDPLEDCKDYIDWYEHRQKVGDEYETFNTMPTARTSFVYHELIDENILTKKRVRLDTFIRSGGTRLEGNFANIQNFLDGKIDKHGNWILQEVK